MSAWEEKLFDAGLPGALSVVHGSGGCADPSLLGLRARQLERSGSSATYVPGSCSHSGVYKLIGQGMAARGVFTRIIDTCAMVFRYGT